MTPFQSLLITLGGSIVGGGIGSFTASWFASKWELRRERQHEERQRGSSEPSSGPSEPRVREAIDKLRRTDP